MTFFTLGAIITTLVGILSVGTVLLVAAALLWGGDKLELLSIETTRGDERTLTFKRNGKTVKARGRGSSYRWISARKAEAGPAVTLRRSKRWTFAYTAIGDEVPHHILEWIWKQVALAKWQAESNADRHRQQAVERHRANDRRILEARRLGRRKP